MSVRKRLPSMPARVVLLCLVMLGSLLQLGCGGDSDPVTVRDSIPPTRRWDGEVSTPPGDTTPRYRMLAAINEQPGDTWFFKMTGSLDQVADAESKWNALLSSVQFADGQPQWTLPEGWIAGEPRAMRFATLHTGAPDASAEISISSLPPGQPLGMNINRWRGQLGLAPVPESDIPGSLTEVAAVDSRFRVYDARGPQDPSAGGSGMMGGGAPFAGGMAPPSAETTTTDPHGGALTESGDADEPLPPNSLAFTTPDGWEEGKSSSFVAGRWSLATDDGPVELALMRMNDTWESWEMNVRAWANQVGMEQEPDPKQITETIPVAGTEARFARLGGQVPDDDGKAIDRSILVVMFTDEQENGWVVKFAGDLAAVNAQRSVFDAFIESIEFR